MPAAGSSAPVEREDEYLAVADAARAGDLLDHLADLVHVVVVDDELERFMRAPSAGVAARQTCQERATAAASPRMCGLTK